MKNDKNKLEKKWEDNWGAIYESSERKLGWRFTARLPYARSRPGNRDGRPEKWCTTTPKWSRCWCFARWPWEKITENVVARITKIHRELIKSPKHNGTHRFHDIPFFWKCWFLRFVFEQIRSFIFLGNWETKNLWDETRAIYESSERKLSWRFTARCSSETVAKRTRRGGCTTVLLAMKT